MIGVVDIGNTRTKLALFRDDGVVAAEKNLATGEPFTQAAASFFSSMLDRAVIGSVVPASTPQWADFLLARANILHVAGHDSPWGFRVDVETPEKTGVDRLANLEGALNYSGAVLVVDAGTATKFDLLEGVTPRSFPGGAIAPGLSVSFEAMVARAAQLREIELDKHSPVVGYNTETAVRSGVLHGFAALVDGMVAKIFEERGLRAPFTVVATGGNSHYLTGRARLVSHHRPRLTLEGLHELAKKI
ncbi:MAG: type III pantothenate kinase [Bdellovibrionota bacterium]